MMDTKGLMFPKPKDMVKKESKKKNKRSKRAEACDIPIKVKRIVLLRDKGKCVICEKAGIPNSHYIKRSQGGLGIEQNVVCMCVECHNAYDNGNDTERTELIHKKTKKYLKKYYGKTWKEKDLYYKKGQIYGINAKDK